MLSLITSYVSRNKALCQQVGLMEGQAKPLTSDSVHATGSIADESNIL